MRIKMYTVAVTVVHQTVRVTDMTSSSAFTKSIGSLFSTINKSVSSAFSSLMAPASAASAPAETSAQPPAVLDATLQPHYPSDWHQPPQLYTDPSAYRGTIRYDTIRIRDAIQYT